MRIRIAKVAIAEERICALVFGKTGDDRFNVIVPNVRGQTRGVEATSALPGSNRVVCADWFDRAALADALFRLAAVRLFIGKTLAALSSPVDMRKLKRPFFSSRRAAGRLFQKTANAPGSSQTRHHRWASSAWGSRTSKISHAYAWREPCVSTDRDKHMRWL